MKVREGFGDLKVDGKITILLPLPRGNLKKKCSYVSNLPFTLLDSIGKYLPFGATLGKNT
jgi:hypothetical protein